MCVIQKPCHNPNETKNLHHEVELVVAIGPSDGQNHETDVAIYGYAVGIDFTRRDIQSDLKKAARALGAFKDN